MLAFISLLLLAGCSNAMTKPSAKPQISEDYYGFINYDLLQQKTIPATEGAWSYFYELNEKTSGLLQEIVTELADDPGAYPMGSSEQKISDLYHCATNLDLRNTQGLAAIAPYLTQLDAAQTLDQYLDALIALSDIGESSLIVYGFYPDDLDSDIMMVGFESMSDLQVAPITSGGGYLSNVVGLQQATRQYEYDQYKKGVDRQTWYITPQTINAYYNPTNNEICFPAAILQAPFYDAQSSRGKNLGGIGAIIAHEISHAFDKTGSLYDEKGNYNIWWTEKEYQQYEALSQKIIDYYGNYTIFTGDPVNGTLTLSENIADLGAVTAITAVAKEEGASLDDLYSNWATIWANQTTPDQAKEHVINNTHAPAEIRANAVLSSMDGFYECYDIKAGDQMYVAPENRVGIWQTK
jgi:predicted metalloendopeptidase